MILIYVKWLLAKLSRYGKVLLTPIDAMSPTRDLEESFLAHPGSSIRGLMWIRINYRFPLTEMHVSFKQASDGPVLH